MKKGTFWVGIVSGLLLSALVGFLILPFLGVFDTTATGKPNILDWWGHTNLENYVARNAPDSSIPPDVMVEEGFEHYRTMCLHCHGAPDINGEEWAPQMLPQPPELWDEDVQHMSDGELFFIIGNGIRMTGMPAFGPIHSEKDIWNLVAFVRQINQLTEDQKHVLQQTASKYGHDEADEHHGKENEGEHGHSSAD